MFMVNYLVGADIGTQGTKTVLFDTDMNPVAQSFLPSRLISPAPGTTWEEPEAMFDSVIAGVRQVTERSGVSPGSVLALGVDSQMAGILGVDRDGRPSTVYDSWLDTRCAPQASLMRERAGKKITEITGGPVTCTHGPKILWWKERHPEAYRRTCKFVLPHGYVAGRLCGLPGNEFPFDHTCLQYSGFGENQKKCWSPELLELFGVDPAKMARIVSPFEILGGMTREYADAMGLCPGTPVAAGAGDTACSIFGSGLFENGELLDCAGTASVLCCAVDSFVPDTEFDTMTMMRSPLDGVWYPLAYINGGGMDLHWFRREFTGEPPLSYRELEEKAAALPCGSEGLVFVPHFSGRVLPSDPSMKGAFLGLDWRHSREHLFRAVMEGISYEYAYYLRVLRRLYPQTEFRHMTAVGGGAKSGLFLSLKADILGLNVSPLQTGDTAPVGSAVIAGMGAGVFSDCRAPIERTLRRREDFLCRQDRYRDYGPYREAYLQALEALSPLYRRPPWNVPSTSKA